MEQAAPPTVILPHQVFTREEWAKLRADTPLTLTNDDLARLKSLDDPISLEEVAEIYLPLSRLLSLYVAATQSLHDATRTFLGIEDGVTPFIIGIAGSVAVGKSTPRPHPRGAAPPLGRTRRRSISSPPTASCCRTLCWCAKA